MVYKPTFTSLGHQLPGLLHIADWYATLCRLAGLAPHDVRDLRAAAAGLPPLDSLDVWRMLTEGEKSPREVIPLGPEPWRHDENGNLVGGDRNMTCIFQFSWECHHPN